MLCFWCLQLGPPHRCPLGPSHHKPCPWRPYCFSPPSQQLQCMNLQCMSATNPHHISPQTSMAHFATNIHSAFRHKHPWRSPTSCTPSAALSPPHVAHRRQHSFPAASLPLNTTLILPMQTFPCRQWLHTWLPHIAPRRTAHVWRLPRRRYWPHTHPA